MSDRAQEIEAARAEGRASTQRHWWTWQQAIASTVRDANENDGPLHPTASRFGIGAIIAAAIRQRKGE